MKNKNLKKRIIEISYKNSLSHLGSCLTSVDIIDEIFSIKKPDEKFVLSPGHAGLALYVVLEKYDKPKELIDGVKDYKNLLDAEEIFNHHGVHPDRCDKCHIDCSSGSLGHGIGIAVGMALSDRSKNVYCLISDGESAEGSVFESLRIAAENELTNLKVYLNNNGWGAYRRIIIPDWSPLVSVFPIEVRTTNFNGFPFLKGQDAHYHVMTEKEYKEAILSLDDHYPTVKNEEGRGCAVINAGI